MIPILYSRRNKVVEDSVLPKSDCEKLVLVLEKLVLVLLLRGKRVTAVKFA